MWRCVHKSLAQDCVLTLALLREIRGARGMQGGICYVIATNDKRRYASVVVCLTKKLLPYLRLDKNPTAHATVSSKLFAARR